MLLSQSKWPGDSVVNLFFLSQATICLHTRWRLHTAPFHYWTSAEKLWIPTFIVFVLTTGNRTRVRRSSNKFSSLSSLNLTIMDLIFTDSIDLKFRAVPRNSGGSSAPTSGGNVTEGTPGMTTATSSATSGRRSSDATVFRVQPPTYQIQVTTIDWVSFGRIKSTDREPTYRQHKG